MTDRKGAKEKFDAFMNRPLPGWMSGVIVSLIGMAVFVGGAAYGAWGASQVHEEKPSQATYSNASNNVVLEKDSRGWVARCTGAGEVLHPNLAESLRTWGGNRGFAVHSPEYPESVVRFERFMAKNPEKAMKEIGALLKREPTDPVFLQSEPGHTMCQYQHNPQAGGAQ